MFIRKDSASALPSLSQNPDLQTSWDPSTISNIVFGIIMVFVGIVAIWQGRHRQVVAVDEELAIIRPLRRSTSTLNHPVNRSASGAYPHRPQLMLHDTSTASLPIAQIITMNAGANENGLPDADPDGYIAMVSNRVTTLSTMGTVEKIKEGLCHDPASELEGAAVEGRADITETSSHEGTLLEQTL